MNIKEIYALYSKHYLVDTDTRSIRPNSIYFALKGENFNGNKFANEALEKGASYAIVDEASFATSTKVILVDNVLITLQNLAKHHREILGLPIIGLTGSNGKTTTKELINAILSTTYNTTATVGNLNNHIGVPLTLLSMNPNTEIGIVEMGANHLEEISFLCKIAKPDYGYITNFGKAHLEGFGSLEGVIKGKTELYDYLKSHKKTVFINPKDEIQISHSQEIKSIPFEPSIQLLKVNPTITIQLNNQSVSTLLIGKYNYNNILAAITIGQYFNVGKDHLRTALEGYTPTNNRSQVITSSQNNTLILDAYNANPTSIKAALDSFYQQPTQHKLIILGDMFELGNYSELEHQRIADYCRELKFANVLFVGKHFSKTKTHFVKLSSFDELKRHISSLNITHTHILIKGSRGMALERITAYL